MKFLSYCVSHIGTTRQNNEDNFLFNGSYISPNKQRTMNLQSNQFVSLYGMQESKVQLYAISDGMGGHNSGEVASYIIVDLLSKIESKLCNYSNIKDMCTLCQRELSEISHYVCALSKEKPEMKNMGATITLLLKYKKENLVLNIGDSRTYFFDGAVLSQITKDHTEGQRLFDLKLLTKEEVERFPAKNNLSKYMGMNTGDAILKADEFINYSTRNGWFLLCSDGLTCAIKNEEIEEIIKKYYKNNQLEQAANELLYCALKGINGRSGSKDNITIMIVQN